MKRIGNLVFIWIAFSGTFFNLESTLKVGIIADWGIPCGIAEYSKHVHDGLIEHGVEVKKYDHSLSVFKILNLSKNDKIQVLNIQYDPGLFPNLNQVKSLIELAHNQEIKVVITVHEEYPHTVSDVFSLADYIIFHKSPLFCKDSRISILPIPVPVFDKTGVNKNTLRTKYGFSTKEKIISTTGFIFIQKRLPEILTLLAPYLHKDPHIKIQFLNAITPRALNHCTSESKRLNETIQKHKLQNQVIFISDFLPEAELRERLYLSDIGFTWFDVKINSVSATQKEFVSARLPFIINDNSHFDSIQGCVRTVTDMNVFVDQMISLLNNSIKKSQLRKAVEVEYENSNYLKGVQTYIKAFNYALGEKI